MDYNFIIRFVFVLFLDLHISVLFGYSCLVGFNKSSPTSRFSVKSLLVYIHSFPLPLFPWLDSLVIVVPAKGREGEERNGCKLEAAHRIQPPPMFYVLDLLLSPKPGCVIIWHLMSRDSQRITNKQAGIGGARRRAKDRK